MKDCENLLGIEGFNGKHRWIDPPKWYDTPTGQLGDITKNFGDPNFIPSYFNKWYHCKFCDEGKLKKQKESTYLKYKKLEDLEK